MVDYPHLSGGNSSSPSSSRDLFADFGVSNPNSASVSSDGSSENDYKSFQILAQKTIERGVSEQVSFDSSVPIALGGEQNPLDLLASEGVLIDSSSSNSEEGTNVGRASAVELKDVFKAASYFSKKDRSEAVEERKKNLDLMNFISTHGFSMQDVNDFVKNGAKTSSIDVQQVLVKSPGKTSLADKTQGNFVVGSTSRCVSLEESDKIGSTNGSTDGCLKGSDGASVDASIPQKPSWSDVVLNGKHSTSFQLDYFPPIPPSSADSPILIKPPIEVLKEGNSLWSTCLVGGFLNSRMPFKLVNESAHKLWDKFGLKSVFLQDKGYFVFKFSCSSDRDNVLAHGPWYIANKLIVLKYWKEGIDFQNEACTKAPVWVKFHHVPMSYWTPKGLSFLASGIGKPLSVDPFTGKLEPMNFAKICIEITPTSPLPNKVEVVVHDDEFEEDKIITVDIEYINKPACCSNCKSFGHSLYKCPRANYKWVPKKSTQDESPDKLDIIPLSTSIPSAANLISLAPQDLDMDQGWTSVAKGNKHSSKCVDMVVSPLVPACSLPVVDPVVSSPDPGSAPPNPLVAKLKIIDEKEGRDLKNKAKFPPDSNLKAKKKSKGGGAVPKST